LPLAGFYEKWPSKPQPGIVLIIEHLDGQARFKLPYLSTTAHHLHLVLETHRRPSILKQNELLHPVHLGYEDAVTVRVSVPVDQAALRYGTMNTFSPNSAYFDRHRT